MQAKKKLKKWWQVLSPGQEGDEETRVMIALARHPKYTWRSVDALRKESGVPQERVEKILERFFKMGVVLQSPTNEDAWGYWERNPDVIAGESNSLTQTDHDDRIDKILNPDMVTNSSGKKANGMNAPLHDIDVSAIASGKMEVSKLPIMGSSEFENSVIHSIIEGHDSFHECTAAIDACWLNTHAFTHQTDDQLHFIQEASDRQLVMSLLNNPTLAMIDSEHFPQIPALKLN